MRESTPDGLASERASVQRLLRLLAGAGVTLMLGVVVSSAYLRLSQAGFSCADWPSCYGRIAAPVATTGATIARLVHRVAASAVGIVLIAALLVSLAQRPRLVRQCLLAGAALAVALVLAALGSRSSAEGGMPSVAVMLANLGGGFALLALTWWLLLTALPRDPPLERRPPWLPLAAALTLALAIGQMALGALTSTKLAALACPGFPGCGADWSAGALVAALNPLAERALAPDGAVARTSELAAVHSAHRVGALVLGVLGAAVALALLRTGRAAARLGAAIGALLAAELALGAAMVAAGFPLALVLAHNACAALLLLALIAANRVLNLRQPVGRATASKPRTST